MNDSIRTTTSGITTLLQHGPNATSLLRINPDVAAADALAHGANLQRIANQLMLDSAMGDSGSHTAWAAVYLGEIAEAIMEDLMLMSQDQQ